MKKRNPFAVLVLSIVTLGIYDLYWLASTRKELNKTTSIKVPSLWLLISPAILFIGALIAVAASAASERPKLSAYNGTATAPDTMSAIFVLVYFLGIIVMMGISFFWFWRYSKAVHEYTKGEMSFPVAFLMLWILHLIGVVFIQDQFNNHSLQAGAAGPAPAAPAGPMPTQSPIQAPAPPVPSEQPFPPGPIPPQQPQ
jgi:hypothetical protein